MPHRGTLPPLSNPDFPTEDEVRLWGDFVFLAMRCPWHRNIKAGQLRQVFEPALLTGQYKVFRVDGVARGIITYGLLSYDAEYRYLSGEVLTAADWRSGQQLWITNMLAPYGGLTRAIARWAMTPGNLTSKSFYYRRVTPETITKKILHVNFEDEDRRLAVLSSRDFGVQPNLAQA